MPRRVQDLPERLQKLVLAAVPPELADQVPLWELGEASHMVVYVHERDQRWTRFGRPSH